MDHSYLHSDQTHKLITTPKLLSLYFKIIIKDHLKSSSKKKKRAGIRRKLKDICPLNAFKYSMEYCNSAASVMTVQWLVMESLKALGEVLHQAIQINSFWYYPGDFQLEWKILKSHSFFKAFLISKHLTSLESLDPTFSVYIYILGNPVRGF